jgi:hypothetical protein
MAFSWKGDMVAIASHTSRRGRIKILRSVLGNWSYWGESLIPVLEPGRPQYMHTASLTGISLCISPWSRIPVNSSFRNDECLAISWYSTDPGVPDCYRITQEGSRFRLEPDSTQIGIPGKGTTNLAIAISQSYDAVALLNREGIELLGT